MALILTGSSGSTTLDSSAGLTFSDSSNQQYAASPYVLKNRIINGDMRIDQRNAGASFTPTTSSGYSLDRWRLDVSQNSKLTVQQNAGSVTPPTGFTNYLGVTSSSSYSVGAGDFFILVQAIEGYNVADLNLGSSSGQSFTISFRVRSSLTGTFTGAVNGGNSSSATYPFSYTISSANTWETKTITIPATSLGTGWGTTNTLGIQVFFNLGCGATYGGGTAGAWASGFNYAASGGQSVVGTNGATFYITGVQLEVGSTATPFERRLYGQELALCQRYCNRIYLNAPGILGIVDTTTSTIHIYYAPVVMRTTPTLTTTGTASNYQIRRGGGSTICSAVPTFDGGTSENNMLFRIVGTVASGLTVGQACFMNAGGSETYLILTAEL